MDYTFLHYHIKELCAERGINISLLEKKLNFSSGAISRWKQSSPSIDKVLAVAKFFGITLDELCGMKVEDEDSEFVQCVIQRTIEDKLYWYSYSEKDLFENKFSPAFSLEEMQEGYISQLEEGKLFLFCKDELSFELYIMIENRVGYRQNENREDLKNLWDAIKDQGERERERVKLFKKKFIEGNFSY